MPWPTSQIAETSAAATWARLCADASRCRTDARFLRTEAEAGYLAPATLRRFIPGFRAAREFLTANDGVAGLQDYARLVSDPAFALAAESAALKNAYAAVATQGRALHNATRGEIAADGGVTEPLQVIPAAQCAALIAACAALESAVV